MDELERELKEVQLQREKLALERELTRKRRWDWLNGGGIIRAASMGGRAAQDIARSTGRFLRRWWKVAASAAIVLIGVMGGVELNRIAAEKREEEERSRRWAEVDAFVLKECGKKCIGNGSVNDNFACDAQNLDRYFPCASEARKRFAETQN